MLTHDVLTLSDLLACLTSRGQLQARLYSTTTAGTVVGSVLAVELEDGSGDCWNVTINMPNGTRRTVFVRF